MTSPQPKPLPADPSEAFRMLATIAVAVLAGLWACLPALIYMETWTLRRWARGRWALISRGLRIEPGSKN